MASWRRDDAQFVHDLIAWFESGPGLELHPFESDLLSRNRLTRLERTAVVIQFAVVAIFTTAVVAFLLL